MASPLTSLNYQTVQDLQNRCFQNLCREQNCSFSTLPTVIFYEIFNFLQHKDLIKLTFVSKSLNIEVLEAKAFNDEKILRSFINQITNHLDPVKNLESIQKLSLFKKKIKVDNSKNFHEIKRCVLDIKKQLIDVLKDLDKYLLEELSDNEEMRFFFLKNCSLKDVFIWSLFEQKVRAALNIDDPETKSHEMKFAITSCYLRLQISNRLQYLERLVEVANSIPDRLVKNFCLHDFTYWLIGDEKIEEAQKLVQQIEMDDLKTRCLMKLFKVFLRYGRYDQAQSIVAQIINPDLKSRCWKDLSKNLQDDGNLDKSLELAIQMNQSLEKSSRLFELVRAFSNKKLLEKALEVANLIQDEHIKDLSLEEIDKHQRDANLDPYHVNVKSYPKIDFSILGFF